MCVEPILISLNPICDDVGIIFSLAPFEDVLPNESLVISTITKSVFILPNSLDPGETPRFAASQLDLRCLYMFTF